MTPYGHFTDGEKALFLQGLSKAHTYLEWGMGNSTLWALETKVEKVIAVEGCEGYLKDWVNQQAPIVCAQKQRRLRIVKSDTGTTRPYTEPDVNLTLMGMAYSMPKTRQVPDFALVDGRFRVACAITCALMKIRKVAVHDFNGRPHYKAMLEFFEIMSEADSMVMLRLKPRINIKEALTRRAEYFKDPR
jgi:hypothetical protein